MKTLEFENLHKDGTNYKIVINCQKTMFGGNNSYPVGNKLDEFKVESEVLNLTFVDIISVVISRNILRLSGIVLIRVTLVGVSTEKHESNLINVLH